jgi:hypothetical protein
MAEIKIHPVHGSVEILERSTSLVRIGTTEGNEFWVLTESFTKKPPKPRAKKPKVIRKVDDLQVIDLVDDLAAISLRSEELPDGIELFESEDESVYEDEPDAEIVR